MLHKIYIFTAIVFLVVLSSCSRERIEPTKQLNEYESLDNYLDSKKQAEQEFEITDAGSGPIEGTQGTKIWISKDILMFPDGSDVDWPFTVKLVELYSPKDMIYYQMPTVSQGNILENEGEVRVRAFKEDGSGTMQELVLKPDAVYSLQMPSDSARDNLKVYYGYESNNKPNWTTSSTSLGGNSADLYFSELSGAHWANIGRLGWINCGTSHQGFFSISFTSEEDDLSNIEIFAYVPENKAVAQAYSRTTCEFPNNTEVKILAMAINADQELFYQYGFATITADGSIPIELQPITDAELTAILDGL